MGRLVENRCPEPIHFRYFIVAAPRGLAGGVPGRNLLLERTHTEIFTGFIHDITQRQQTDAQLKDLQAELAHVGRVNEMPR